MARYKTYTLRIECEREGNRLLLAGEEALQVGLQNAEDVVNDVLPDGFYCKIDEAAEIRLPTFENIGRGEGVDLAAVRRLEEMS